MAKKMVFEQYDNLTAFAKSLERPVNSVFKGDCSSHRTDDPNWFMTRNFEEAVNLFNNGWTEKVEEIRKSLVQFAKANERNVSYQKSRPETSVVGFAPHVPNAILGLPNSMIKTERTPMKAKVVRIVYHMTMNGNARAETIMNAGVTVLKIAHSLEMKGYRVRIDVLPKLSTSSKNDCCLLVCVKDWRQPIDIKKVAFPIGHPSMFRRLGFRWMETCPDFDDRSLRGSYGRCPEDASEAKEMLRRCKVFDDKDLFVNVSIAKRCGFDPAKTAEAIGIKL